MLFGRIYDPSAILTPIRILHSELFRPHAFRESQDASSETDHEDRDCFPSSVTLHLAVSSLMLSSDECTPPPSRSTRSRQRGFGRVPLPVLAVGPSAPSLCLANRSTTGKSGLERVKINQELGI